MSCVRDAGVDGRIPDTAMGDLVPPQVTLIVPGGDATNVPVSTTIQAGFSEDVANSEQALSLRLGSGNGEVVAGTVTYDPALRVATFTPDSPLVGNFVHTAMVSTLVTDLAGNPLVQPVSWMFTTGPDSTAPAVVATFPPNGATNVTASTPIVVELTEPVLFFNAANVTVTVGATPVTGTFSTSGPRTWVFTPDTDLPAASTVDVSLSSGITDYSSNMLTATAFSFTTQ